MYMGVGGLRLSEGDMIMTQVSLFSDKIWGGYLGGHRGNCEEAGLQTAGEDLMIWMRLSWGIWGWFGWWWNEDNIHGGEEDGDDDDDDKVEEDGDDDGVCRRTGLQYPSFRGNSKRWDPLQTFSSITSRKKCVNLHKRLSRDKTAWIYILWYQFTPLDRIVLSSWHRVFIPRWPVSPFDPLSFHFSSQTFHFWGSA